MTNAEKFKTAEERTEAFDEFCDNNECTRCPLFDTEEDRVLCAFSWLDLEYNEELKPCPFCGGEARIIDFEDDEYRYYQICCTKCKCKMDAHIGKHNAIDAWNRRAK
jgi:Lar family restriction alleviation protein